MSYITKRDGVKTSPPRKLTPSEIETVLNTVPSVTGASKESEQLANVQIRERLRFSLSNKEITPDGIPDLIKEMSRMFERSRIAIQTPVGIMATESLSKPITQTTLNTFHSSGISRNVSGGLDAIREMLNASKELKTETINVTLLDNTLSYIEAYRKRRSFVGLTVGDLVNDYDIIQNDDSFEDVWWHRTGSIIRGKPLPFCDWILRLRMNVDKVFQYRVTFERIAKAIEGSGNSKVVVVYSSVHEGIIDIFPILEELSRISDIKTSRSKRSDLKISGFKHPDLVFLENIVRPKMSKVFVQGVEHIKELYVIPRPVWNLVFKEEKMTPSEWYLQINTRYIRQSGVTEDALVKLLDIVGVKIEQKPHRSDAVRRYLVSTPEPVESIGEWIRGKLRDTEEKDKENFSTQRMNRDIKIPPLNDPLIQASYVQTLQLVGTKDYTLESIMGHKDVNPKYTYCNNIHKMYKVVGILAARNMMMQQLVNISSSVGASINPRHIDIFIALVFSQGKPNGITFSGINSGDSGFMTHATFQQTSLVLQNAAISGSYDPVLAPSSTIIHGQKLQLGSGGVDVFMTQKYEEMLKEIENNQVMNALDLETELDQYTSDSAGQIQLPGEIDLPAFVPAPPTSVKTGKGTAVPTVTSTYQNFIPSGRIISGINALSSKTLTTRIYRSYHGLTDGPTYYQILPPVTTDEVFNRFELPRITYIQSFDVPIHIEVKVELVILPDDFDTTYDMW